LLGLALHPGLLRGDNYVYAGYTYVDRSKGAVPAIADPTAPTAISTAKSFA